MALFKPTRAWFLAGKSYAFIIGYRDALLEFYQREHICWNSWKTMCATWSKRSWATFSRVVTSRWGAQTIKQFNSSRDEDLKGDDIPISPPLKSNSYQTHCEKENKLTNPCHPCSTPENNIIWFPYDFIVAISITSRSSGVRKRGFISNSEVALLCVSMHNFLWFHIDVESLCRCPEIYHCWNWYGSDLQTLEDQAQWVLKKIHDLDPR